jgi:hypothetical protein
MPRFLILPLFFAACVFAAKPMEPLTNYNVIMVHGAADMRSGLDCANDSKLDGAWEYNVPDAIFAIKGK